MGLGKQSRIPPPQLQAKESPSLQGDRDTACPLAPAPPVPAAAPIRAQAAPGQSGGWERTSGGAREGPWQPGGGASQPCIPTFPRRDTAVGTPTPFIQEVGQAWDAHLPWAGLPSF